MTATGDPDALAALHAQGFTTPRPWSAAEIAALLANPGCFLVEDDSGFALGRAIFEEAELLTLVVAPAARRRGLARRLLARFEAEARSRGANNAFLEVSAANSPALALYHSTGWQQVGRRPRYYRTPDGERIDALLMAKAL